MVYGEFLFKDKNGKHEAGCAILAPFEVVETAPLHLAASLQPGTLSSMPLLNFVC